MIFDPSHIKTSSYQRITVPPKQQWNASIDYSFSQVFPSIDCGRIVISASGATEEEAVDNLQKAFERMVNQLTETQE